MVPVAGNVVVLTTTAEFVSISSTNSAAVLEVSAELPSPTRTSSTLNGRYAATMLDGVEERGPVIDGEAVIEEVVVVDGIRLDDALVLPLCVGVRLGLIVREGVLLLVRVGVGVSVGVLVIVGVAGVVADTLVDAMILRDGDTV